MSVAAPLHEIPPQPRKGRGAVSNVGGRYEATRHVAVDDGWGSGDAPLPRLRTTVASDATRSVITRNESPDVPFEQSINPYRGCEHGCVYCYARPSHAWLGLSPGLDFETRLFAKPEAARLLAAELRRPGYRCRIIAMGTNTDPYQPVEKRLGITRDILRVLADCRHPVGIVTKSALVLRDVDILSAMARDGLVSVFLSVTTLDRDLARRLEPRAATPGRRLDAIRGLAEAGVPVGVMAAPMIPALNDMALEGILEAAADAGAEAAGYTLLRLPMEVKALFVEWLETHAPDRAGRVLKLVRETRGGRLNDSDFGARMRGVGPYADLLARRFTVACRRLGLERRNWRLDTGLFRPPPEDRDQLVLL